MFKVGDKVVRTAPSIFYAVKEGQEYTVSEVLSDTKIALEGLKGYVFWADWFTLSESVPNPEIRWILESDGWVSHKYISLDAAKEAADKLAADAVPKNRRIYIYECVGYSQAEQAPIKHVKF